MKSLMKTKKLKRFADGGEVDELEQANNSQESQDIAASVGAGPKADDSPAPARKQSFNEAFAAARRSGVKTFEWNGKKFGTQMASSSPSAPVAGRPRGESVGEPKRSAPMFAADNDFDRNLEAKIRARNGAAADELKRESRGSTGLSKEARVTQAAAASSGKSNPYYGKTGEQRMKDMRGYASGGLVKRGTLKSHGKAC